MFRAAIVSALVATASAQLGLPVLGGVYGVAPRVGGVVGGLNYGVVGGLGLGLPTTTTTTTTTDAGAINLSGLGLGQTLLGGAQTVYGVQGGMGGVYGGQYRDPEINSFTPVFGHVNPNSVSSYVNQLYEHGQNMLNRVKQQLGGRLEGPPINRVPITIPAGYTPQNMEQLYGHLFSLASCLSPSYFQRQGPRVHPGPTWDNWNPRTPYTLDNCLYDLGQRWNEDYLEPYIVGEAKSLLDHLQHNPRTGLIAVPSFANFWRTHTPIEERALIDTVVASYNLIDRMIDETYRTAYPGPGRVFSQDFNELVATPRALLDFGFPPGFAPTNDGVDADWYSLDLTVRAMLCRSQIGSLTGRRTVPAADPFVNADGTPNYENWPQQYGYNTGRGSQGYGGTFGGFYNRPYGGAQNVGPWGWNQINGGGETPYQFRETFDGPTGYGFPPLNNWRDPRWYGQESAYSDAPMPPTYADITGRFANFVNQEDCFTSIITDWFFDEAEDMVDEILSSAINFVRPVTDAAAAVDLTTVGAVGTGVVGTGVIGTGIVSGALPEFPGYTWDAVSGTFVATGNAGRLTTVQP